MAPEKLSPSSLTTCISVNIPEPYQGWWGLMNSIALPSRVFDGATAHWFEPRDAASSSASRGSRPRGAWAAPSRRPRIM